MKRSMLTMDGNTAAAHASYAYTEVAAIYPITPSSVMAEVSDQWATLGRKNIFGETVKITEMQSEAGAAGTVHGSLAAGALTSTYTASQGLLLMIPNLYKIAGERLPGVINVSARAIASHALNIFGDHSDVYACRQTGVAMLCESSVQEVMDLTPVAYMAAIEGRLPFINFFDGFRTSHEIQKIETWDYEDLKEMYDFEALKAYRDSCLNPENPCQMGSAQNPDLFFQTREACNPAYIDMPDIVQNCMNRVNERIGTDYKLFNYYGAEDADHVVIAMGSVCEALTEAVDYLVKRGDKVGVVKVRLYRPFSTTALIDALPHTTRKISVLDRTKEPGSIGEPLYLDVVAALKGSKFEGIKVFHGRYGLGSKDTRPGQLMAVFHNNTKPEFTIGIKDDMTKLSLDFEVHTGTIPKSTINCKFWGLGSDGTVGANKNSIKIIGNNTDKYAQAYFDYDSKKSGGVTVSHLRFGQEKIHSTYLIGKCEFVACHCTAYIFKYDMVQDILPGGTFLLNCPWDVEELDKVLPGQVKRHLAENNINFYTIDAVKLGQEIGLGNRVNTILQAAFFKVTEIIPVEDAVGYMKEAAKKAYGKKGNAIVQMNYDAIDAGINAVNKIEIPESWLTAEEEDLLGAPVTGDRKDVVDFVNDVQRKVNAQLGNTIPVSVVSKYADGSTPSGSSAYEKRGIATLTPIWEPTKCVACNLCSYVCPHATIRPAVCTDEEVANAPEGFKPIELKGTPYKVSMVVSAYDCTGCGSCVSVCPTNAITLSDFLSNADELQKHFDYGMTVSDKPEIFEKFKPDTVKGSQYKQPLLEFSGACAGCGETPYAKLLTQLFGDRMYIANATGCSSIWGNSSPSTPYTVNKRGQGPAWSNSLFEDAAEFGLGMYLGAKTIRERLKGIVKDVAANAMHEEVKEAAQLWLATYNSGIENGAATDRLVAAMEAQSGARAKELLKDKQFLSKKSQWIFGGDGWAYDIGFGGLDHVLASGQDINIMVFDTEVYSNTGGQASKATPTGATAQFAAGGKEIKKKDLASIAMSYGYVYVAQVSMGADYAQCVKAIAEAEAYPGPSLIIAYAPCINHGIKKGMSKAQEEMKDAVAAGYWHNFRFDPRKVAAGEAGFMLDSKAPTKDYKEFLNGEVRYNALARMDPEKAEKLFAASEKAAKERYEYLEKLQAFYGKKAE
ncbi:MAG: pyruvate:ferredoxin (flavodoxin) oxidoreductase [Eubacterium sp.]|nr:pyruvate:ferredoxin (flavodoxin) oxidoreductase [Eubacterium sp.]